jgi:hypothetical protein
MNLASPKWRKKEEIEEWTSGSLQAENGRIDIEKAFFHVIFLLR